MMYWLGPRRFTLWPWTRRDAEYTPAPFNATWPLSFRKTLVDR